MLTVKMTKFVNEEKSHLIFDAFEYAFFQLGDDPLLLFQWNALQSLLDHSAAVHLQSQWLHVGTELKWEFIWIY
jgi:hypothetical protein